MTAKQQFAINKMTEAELRKTISVSFNNREIVEYCEARLERLKVDDALVEFTPLDDFGGNE